jgi:hypothetical protein
MRVALTSLLLPLALLAAGCSVDERPRRDAGGTGGTDAPGTDAPFVAIDAPGMDYGPPAPRDDDADGLSNEDELARGTDPNAADTDGDGYEDGVEVLAGTDPANSTSLIPAEDFYVVLPYMGEPQLRELSFRARLGRADVFFLIDTTGSMAGALNNVRTSLAGTIVPALGDAIADLHMGVGDFRDFDVDPFGSPGDWPMIVRQTMTADEPTVQTVLNALRVGGGGDGPESSTEGLWVTAAGACAGGGGFGGACFRAMSHPIIVHVTDADFHNGPTASNDYGAAVPGARTWSETLAALNAASVKVVGVAVNTVPIGLPIPPASRDDLDELARRTDSRGASGALTVYTAPAGMVSTSVVDGIVDLVGAETQDVSSRTEDDPSDALDARMFITRVSPLRASRATSFDATTFYGVAGGTEVVFEVEFRNDTTPARATTQVYQAYIEVYDIDTGLALDRRNVYVVIPPDGGILF